jgi:drug/metabolite transporter (DMT)-like permease
MVIGGADLLGVALYESATRGGALSITAVIASLYPAVTALLAWRITGQQLVSLQVAGLATCLSAVALLAF